MECFNKYLHPSGTLVMKTYEGLIKEFIDFYLRIFFKKIMIVKTIAVTSEEEPKEKYEEIERRKELYVICQGYLLSKNKTLRKIMQATKEYNEATTPEKKRKFIEKTEKEFEELQNTFKEKGYNCNVINYVS